MALIGEADKEKRRKADQPIVLTLASFAVTKMAYVKLTKMFSKMYQEQTGRSVAWRLTFAGSGTQVSAPRAARNRSCCCAGAPPPRRAGTRRLPPPSVPSRGP